LLSATNLLYHFPPLFAIAGRMARGEGTVGEPLTSAEFRARVFEGSVLSQSAHFLLASIAVCGTALLLWTWLQGRASAEPSEIDKAAENAREGSARQAAYGALIPTGLQAIVGLWVLTTLPTKVQYDLIGVNVLATAAFGLSMAAALWLASDLASAT